MNKPINFQTILGEDGAPAFVVMPYAEFVRSFKQAGQPASDLVPHAVVELVVEHEMTPAKAWRTHLRLTQDEVAQRMGVTQSAYAQLEASTRLRKASRAKIAKALGLVEMQLDA
jgi:DNA-binding XRE family transcriptional regulator